MMTNHKKNISTPYGLVSQKAGVILTPQKERSVVNRFWRLVDKSGDCWVWQAAKEKGKGYGIFTFHTHKENGKWKRVTIKAHRFVWLITHKELLPDSVILRHRCDNPECVNPNHLLKGTHQDNSNDKMERGRANQGTRTRLTSELVFEIKTRYEAGGITQLQLAGEYGISHRQMQNIINGHVWKHVDVPHQKRGAWGHLLS